MAIQDRKRRRRRPRLNIRVGRELTGPATDHWALMFGRLLINPDRTLESHSTEGLRLYNEMLRKDAQLAMCFRQRALTVMAQGWDIIPASENRADLDLASWVKDVLRGVNHFHLSRTRFFRGISHGYAPAEIIFVRRPDRTIGIERFRNRDPERFRFDKEGNLVLTGLTGSQMRTMPPRKFVINTWGSDETPYGQGLLRELYPLWFFKNNALKELVRFVEKFGAPYLWATYPPGLPADQQDALLEVLKRMQGNSVGIGPEGTEIQITDTSTDGVVDLFRFMIEEYVDRQYAKAILGQTLSTESQSGTFALARFQSKSQQHILEDDALWQMEEMDRVIRTLVDLNFGPRKGSAYPGFRIPYEEEKDLQDYLKAVSIAVDDLGLSVGQRWLREQIGIPAPGEGDRPLEGKSSRSPDGNRPMEENLDAVESNHSGDALPEAGAAPAADFTIPAGSD